jgi:tRNA(Ile)-lysidine synthase
MLLRRLAEASRALDLGGRRVLVAASGGVDSTVLAHALHALSQDLLLNLMIGHVNHGLRGSESEADEDFVRGLGERLGLPVRVERADPLPLCRSGPSRTRPTLQEAARRLRYEALRRMADAAGAERVATAHTADDQAETLLLRLLRGSGPDGLGGIPERSADGRVVRPLLGVAREEILAYAASQGLRWREDASNQSQDYARNRLRAGWLPDLARDFNPRLLRVLGDLAESQRRDSEWIEAQVEREASWRFSREGPELRIERKEWSGVPEALARRLARRALRELGAGRDVSRVHLARMLGFLRGARPGTRLELPGGLELVCEREAFSLRPRRVPPTPPC